MKKHYAHLAVGFAVLSLLSGMACGMSSGHHRAAGSVMSFLYPGSKEAPPVDPVTTLRLPTRVGIAFVPDNQEWGSGLDELSKREILRRVKAEFETRKDLIERIEEIPSSYLQQGGGFANLEQVKAMFQTDVVCLVGYDQLRSTSETKASFFYLTILGAYLVPGNKNETRTLMEATVYDVASKRLLFRAPGSSVTTRRSTLVDLDRNQDRDAREGLQKATDELVTNLRYSLADFEQKIKSGAPEVSVQRRDASGNWVGAAWGPVEMGLLGALLCAALLLRKGRVG